MLVILAAFGEGAFVGHFRARVEHPSIFAVSGNSLPFEILDMLGQRRGAEAAALVTHDTRLHHHAAGVRPKLDGDRRSPAAAEPRAASALFAARMTSPTKVSGRLPPRLPWLIRPGRTRKSSSRVVIAQNHLVQRSDGAGSSDFF